jgi:hypothetical protein
MLYIFGVGMNFFAFFMSQLWRASDEDSGKMNEQEWFPPLGEGLFHVGQCLISK